MLISVERRREVSKVQHLATFLTVYPPPPSTSVGTLKLFTNFTHSLIRIHYSTSGGGLGGPSWRVLTKLEIVGDNK